MKTVPLWYGPIDSVHDMTDIFVIIYLNDILIFSKNLDEHKIHVQKVLEWLQEHNFHAKPEKCKFHTTSMEYLGIIITPEGVRISVWKSGLMTGKKP